MDIDSSGVFGLIEMFLIGSGMGIIFALFLKASQYKEQKKKEKLKRKKED